jgi:hypothetical protein
MAMLATAAAALLALQAGAWDDDEPRYDETRPGRLTLALLGGGSSMLDGSGRTSPWLGGEVGWDFTSTSVSLLAEGHHYDDLRLATRTWTPVGLVRLAQRFETRRGVEGALIIGLGTGKPNRSWVLWYQIAVGIRMHAEPFFFQAEVGFERDEFVRYGAGVGVAF